MTLAPLNNAVQLLDLSSQSLVPKRVHTHKSCTRTHTHIYMTLAPLNNAIQLFDLSSQSLVFKRIGSPRSGRPRAAERRTHRFSGRNHKRGTWARLYMCVCMHVCTCCMGRCVNTHLCMNVYMCEDTHTYPAFVLISRSPRIHVYHV